MSSPDNIQVILNDLERIQDVQAVIQKRYVEDVWELEKKYLKLRAPVFHRAKDLISGDLEPLGRPVTLDTNSISQDQAQPKGIPGFWLRVFQNHPVLKDLITHRDEGVLEHLIDVRLGLEDLSPSSESLFGYTLSFQFERCWRYSGPFTNDVLTKTYRYIPTQLTTGSRYHSFTGTEIKWRKNQEWTGSTFFNFFKSLSLPSEECIRNREISNKDLRQIQDRLKEDFQVGEIIGNEILPGLADWFREKSLMTSSTVTIFAGEPRSENLSDKKDSSWEELIIWSAEYGNTETVRTILQDENISVDVNWRNSGGYSALDYAIGNGSKLIVHELLQRINIDLITPCSTLLLYVTTKRSDSENITQSFIGHPIVSTWFRKRCPEWPETLPAASSGDRKSIITLLLSHGRLEVNINYKGVDGCTPLLRATKYFDAAVVKLLLSRTDIDVNARDHEGCSPLSLVVKSSMANSNPEYIGVVRLLLQHNDININSRDNYGRTALSYAAGEQYCEIMELLLQRRDIDIGLKDTNGFTPLLYAVGYSEDSAKAVRLLLQRNGLDDEVGINARGKGGDTALFHAAQYGHHDVVKELLDHGKGIDVNTYSYSSWTPLTSAAGNGHDEVVKLLLGHRDIEVNRPGAYGKTALHHATRKEKHSTVHLLQQFGAK